MKKQVPAIISILSILTTVITVTAFAAGREQDSLRAVSAASDGNSLWLTAGIVAAAALIAVLVMAVTRRKGRSADESV